MPVEISKSVLRGALLHVSEHTSENSLTKFLAVRKTFNLKSNIMLSLFYLLVIIVCVFSAGGQILVPEENDLTQDTEQLAVSVVHILCNFQASYIYVYFEDNASYDLTEYILKSINNCGSAFISLEYDSNDENVAAVNSDGVMMYLLMILDAADEPINLSHVRKKSADKHRSFFVVILEVSQHVTVGWLRSAFQRFWERWILNVVIIFWDNGLQIYTYSPFSKFFIRKLNASSYYKDELFSIDILNMHRHDLRISLYAEEVRAVFDKNSRLKGSDGFMAELIAERMNATKVIVIPDDNYSGEIYENNSADGSIGYIVRDEADVALNTRYLIRQKFQFRVENTLIYGRDDLCVMVPSPEIQTPLFNIFLSFDKGVWAIVLIAPIVIFLLLNFLFPNEYHNSLTFLSIVGPMLSNSLRNIPKRSAIRILFGFWLAHCLIVLNSYGGNLTSNIVLPRERPIINTIQQLVDSPLEILIYKRFALHIHEYLNSSTEAQLELKQRIRSVSDKYFQDRISANDLTKAYIDKNHITNFRVNSRTHTRHGQRLFHRMNDCPIPFYTVYVVPYGSPYLGYINKILRQTQEHGIIIYWDRHMEINGKLSGKFIILHKRRSEEPMVIKMVHLQIAIYMLIFGLVASCVVFIVELFIFQSRDQRDPSGSINLEIFD